VSERGGGRGGYFEAYDLLINHGGDSSVKDRYGKSAYAYKNEQRERESSNGGHNGLGGGCG
jgi:hypothetical protein